VPPTLLYAMDQCFNDGQFPCRWAAEPGQGYGVPVFNYYGPLPYYVGELAHLGLGLGFFETVDALYVMAFLMSTVFMFLLAREFWGTLGGLVSAAFYIYAPWQASLLYVQGSLAHQWALAFFPAILWAAHKVIREGRPAHVLLLSLFTFALLLSHNLLVVIFLPLALIWMVTLLLVTGNWRRLSHLAIAGIVAFSLAAFFTLPALLEQDLVHLEKAKGGYYFYEHHFVTLEQLFIGRSWGYGPSVPGDADGMSFQIGWLHWALTAVAIILVPLLWKRSRIGFWIALVCVAFFAASVFVMLSRSDFLWRDFSLLRWQLFPFRFLGLTIFTTSFLAAAAVFVAKQRPRLGLLVTVTLIAAVIGLNQEFFHPGQREFGTFSGPVWAIGPRTDVWVLTQPKSATVVPTEPAPAKVMLIAGDADITDVDVGSSNLVFAAGSRDGATLRASVTDFPHWRVRLDGETIPHDHNNEFAAISFDIPPGSHTVELRLEDTTVRKLANYWSLTAWLLFIATAVALMLGASWSAYTNRRRRAEVVDS